jgi:putative SOS response-associated peptidase YedK
MCARYTLTLDQARLVMAGLVHIFAFAPRYNIGPAQRVPVILNTAEGVKAVEMRWGIPSEWSKTLHINAQAENIHQTTTFKPLLGQRCLVPMDGFYEWKPDKSPVRFVRRRRELFCVAGLWKEDDPHRWGEAPDEPPKDGGRLQRTAREDTRPTNLDGTSNSSPVGTGEDVRRTGEGRGAERSFVLLTTAANPSVAPIHDRMPFIVRDDQFDRWLNDPQPLGSAKRSGDGSTLNFQLLSEAPLDCYPVSREVNNVRNESPDLVRPAPIEKELF